MTPATIAHFKPEVAKRSARRKEIAVWSKKEERKSERRYEKPKVARVNGADPFFQSPSVESGVYNAEDFAGVGGLSLGGASGAGLGSDDWKKFSYSTVTTKMGAFPTLGGCDTFPTLGGGSAAPAGAVPGWGAAKAAPAQAAQAQAVAAPFGKKKKTKFKKLVL